MKKYRIILDIINNFITFALGYYMYFGYLLSLIPPKLKRIKIISKSKYENMVFNRILVKGLDENLGNFLSIIQKLSNKKR